MLGTPMLALTGHARLWEPRRLRLRLAGAALSRLGSRAGRPGREPVPQLSSHLALIRPRLREEPEQDHDGARLTSGEDGEALAGLVDQDVEEV